jgi:hypothetical protein
MKRFLAASLTGAALLACLSTALPAAACSPVSASLTYEADDALYFYINGNQVLNGSVHDPGAPPVTVSIPLGYFAPAGSPNYFAAAVVNTAANIVGGGWVISIQCADGSMSYITDEDNSYTMYDDLNGSAPPPTSPTAWYDPAFTDPGSLFTGTPVLAPPIFWFNPALTNPLTGNPLQVLSHSTSATQSSTTEVLYFRQSIVLPVYSPTVTPTPYPTYPPGCGMPTFQSSQTVFQGCPSTMSNSVSLTVPSVANPLLILRMEKGNGGLPAGLPSTVTYDGVALTLLRSDATYSSGGFLATYYLAAPHPGSHTLAINFTANAPCNWNVESEIYSDADQSTPIGAVVVPTGTTTPGVNVSITTTGPASLVSSFFASEQGELGSTGVGQTAFTSGWTRACCEMVEGDYKPVNGPGTYVMAYKDNQSGRKYTGHVIEVRGAAACGTPSNTPSMTPALPSPTATPTFTLSSTQSSSPTRTSTQSPGPSPTNSATQTATPTVTRTPTPSSTQSPGPSPTSSPTFSATPSTTPTGTASSTQSPGPSPTDTPTLTPSPSITPSFSASPSFTVSPTKQPFEQQERLLKLQGLYPNPFSDHLTAYFTLRVAADVVMTTYNVAGEPLWNTSVSLNPGKNVILWDGSNGSGGRCASGAYLLRFTASGKDRTTDEVWDRAVIVR